MGKIKIIIAIIVIYFIYKLFTAIMNFDLAVTERVQKIEQIADIEIVEMEMLLADLESIQKRLEKNKKKL